MKNVLFSFDRSYSMSYNNSFICCVGSSVNLYDVKTGEFKQKLNNVKHPSFAKFTEDNRLIVKTMKGSYAIYDLVKTSLLKTIPAASNVKGSTTDFFVTEDGRYIIDSAHVFPESKLAIVEIETGKYSFYELDRARHCCLFHDKKKNCFYIVASNVKFIKGKETSITEFYDLSFQSQKPVVKKLPKDLFTKAIVADYNSGKFAVQECNDEICIFDINTGECDKLIYENTGILYDLKWSKNGKFLALAESKSMRLYDMETKSCIREYDVDYGCFVDFFDNDKKLLIGTWENGYCVEI